MRVANNIESIIFFSLLGISFSQAPCILGDVYVSEAANAGDDYIEVYNGGGGECTLTGFQLDDSIELEDFTFGNVILSAGDYWLGYEDSTNSFSSGLGGAGDSVVFADAAGSLLITILKQSLETLDEYRLSFGFEIYLPRKNSMHIFYILKKEDIGKSMQIR